jgi:hypothetical protein
MFSSSSCSAPSTWMLTGTSCRFSLRFCEVTVTASSTGASSSCARAAWLQRAGGDGEADRVASGSLASGALRPGCLPFISFSPRVLMEWT